MDNSLKGLILAAGVMITCLVLSIGFYFARESKALSSNSSSKLNDFSSELTESNLIMYDRLEVTGSDVTNFIKKHLGEYTEAETAPIYVYVETSTKENTYKNGAFIEDIKNFSNIKYINPLGKFTGDIVRDANDVIIGIKFIQK